MGIIEAIKKGFGIAAKGMGLVLILVVFNLIWNFASLPFAVAPGTAMSPQVALSAGLLSLVFILFSIFIQGGTLGLVRDLIKDGQMKLASFVSYGFKYYIRLLLLGLLIILIVAVVALIAALLIAGTAPLNNNVITTVAVIIAILIGITAGLLFFVPLTLSPYALICEELGIIASMKKALKVAKSPFSRVFLLLLLFVLLILISIGIGFVIGFLVGLIGALIPAGGGRILMVVATSIVNGYLGVVMMGSLTSYYLALSKQA